MAFEFVPFWCGLLAAVLIGLAKTGIPGVSIAGVLLMTFAFPNQERFSTGAILPVLIVGDVISTVLYRRHVQWQIIGRLIIPTLLGIAIGAYFLATTPDSKFKTILALVVFLLVMFDLCRQYFKWENIGKSRFFGPLLGGTTGFTTMYANAGGPPVYVYLVSQHLTKEQYMATWVWFFGILNLIKLPISCSLGMVNPTTLYFLVFNMLPGLVIGTLIGRRVFLLIPERYFYTVTLISTLVASLGMVVLPFFAGGQ